MNTASDAPSVGIHEAFDRVHDGAQIIDPGRCALALFVTADGKVQIQAPYSTTQVVGMLRQLADKMEARVTSPGSGRP